MDLLTLGWSVILPLFIMIGTSIAYYKYDANESTSERIIASSHGLVASILFVIALLFSVLSKGAAADLAMLFLVLFIIPILLAIVSFIGYRGEKIIHVFQLVNIPTILWAAFASVISLAKVF